MLKMECRPVCGACCIAPSISSSIPGMPNGKKAGERCIQLMDDYSCAIFDSPDRPIVCSAFKAEAIICGSSQAEAMKIITDLENSA